MLLSHALIRFFLSLSIIFLPIAHLKIVIFGLPLYSVEIPILCAAIVYIYGWFRRQFLCMDVWRAKRYLFFSAGSFGLAAGISFITNPVSLSGLGMIKTWFFFPLLALWLWFSTKPTEKERETILFLWLGVILAASLASI